MYRTVQCWNVYSVCGETHSLASSNCFFLGCSVSTRLKCGPIFNDYFFINSLTHEWVYRVNNQSRGATLLDLLCSGDRVNVSQCQYPQWVSAMSGRRRRHGRRVQRSTLITRTLTHQYTQISLSASGRLVNVQYNALFSMYSYGECTI